MGKRRNTITGQWAARSIEMLESPAYRVLSLSAHRVLSRIEIELAHHGGRDNGKLPVTFDDFAGYGVRRHSIAPALDELEILGFIKITQRGRRARGAEYRRPNLFLLTTRPELEGMRPEQCGWRRFKTTEDAEAALEGVKTEGRNLKAASAETALKASAETALKPQKSQCRNGTTTDGRNGTTIYISDGDHPPHPQSDREPERASPGSFRCRKSGTRSLSRWGQSVAETDSNLTAARRPRHSGRVTCERWRKASANLAAGSGPGPIEWTPKPEHILPSHANSDLSTTLLLDGEPSPLVVH